MNARHSSCCVKLISPILTATFNLLGCPCIEQITLNVKNEPAERAAGEMRKLIVIFAILSVLHTLHKATDATEVHNDFKTVVDALESMEQAGSFRAAIVSDDSRHEIGGEGCFFLSGMEREYARGVFSQGKDAMGIAEEVPATSTAGAPEDAVGITEEASCSSMGGSVGASHDTSGS